MRRPTSEYVIAFIVVLIVAFLSRGMGNIGEILAGLFIVVSATMGAAELISVAKAKLSN